ncbi:MAG: 4-hydroxy-3-methylbut-2-enyl diphosphate reductase [Candidatus Accumulibacter sp.]|jgi:4-hydroxy-3-methylbut-2-enyl diphosphate reductase|nr:4-hydroxy-3-methylbut-2-enyl diphosphate reductase [Accumulibacter sp.]
MEVILANPRGFCAGVERAIAVVERAIEKFGTPVYVRHEVVHNRFVCDDLRGKGAIFIEDLDEVPAGRTVIFSAHGVSKAIRREAERRGLKIFDATCPLVTKVHSQVARMRGDGMEIVMIGHKGHPEVEGTMGQSETGIHLVETIDDVRRLRVAAGVPLAYVTQTTLSIDDAGQVIAALKQRFPDIAAPQSDDICYATQNRQDAIKALAGKCGLVIVVGSRSSSNSNRLREVAELHGARAHLIDEAGQIDPLWLRGVDRVGVTAGASAPEILVQRVVDALTDGNPERATQLDGVEEHVIFRLPKELQG